MNVLISDKDASTRRLIGPVLSHQFGVEIVEASNGLDALDKLQQQPFGVLIMEARMPIMGGLETLQVLRESPQFARLPVMILTDERDERRLKQFIALGVQDVILKPINGERFGKRFGRLLKSQMAIEHGANAGSGSQSGSRLSQGASALIADGDIQYREFFRKVAGSRFALIEAASGAKALETSLKYPPAAVFLGTNLGVIGYERIVSGLRAITDRTVRIFAVPPKSEAGAVRAMGLFDDVVLRTYVPALFERELARLVQPLTAFIRFREQVADVHTRIASAVEYVSGTMLMTDVEPVVASPFAEEARGTATVTLTTEAYVVTVRTRIQMSAGRQMAGAFLGSDGADLSDEDVLSVVGELANVLIGRLAAGFHERKLEGALGLPATEIEAPGSAIEPVSPDRGVEVYFRATARPVSFQIMLTVEQSATVADRAVVDEENGVTMLRADA